MRDALEGIVVKDGEWKGPIQDGMRELEEAAEYLAEVLAHDEKARPIAKGKLRTALAYVRSAAQKLAAAVR